MNGYPCVQYPVPPATQAALDSLFAAITSGAKVVQYKDKRVEYHSIEDMWMIYRWLKNSLNSCTFGGHSRVIADYSSGLQRPYGDLETEEHFRDY